MTWRSRLWWGAALTLSALGAVYLTWEREFWYFGLAGFCPGHELVLDRLAALQSHLFTRSPLAYGGAPLLIFGFAAHWVAAHRARPRIGRVLTRLAAAAVLAAYGAAPLAFGVDVAVDRACVDAWGGPEGVWFHLSPSVSPVSAALCALAAVRLPRHRLRALIRGRRFRRVVACAAGLGVLGLTPVADLASGPIDRGPCPSPYPMFSTTLSTGEKAFLCGARQSGDYSTLPDHRLLAYGREQCTRYPHTRVHKALLAPICPPAAADWRREIDAEEAEYARQRAADQAECDRFRHRPLIRPVRVARLLEFSEIGLEAFEDHEDTQEDPDLHHDLVGSAPGSLRISLAADYKQCVTTETYRHRPPVEVKGWDKVIEVGYLSPTGDFTLRDPFGAPELPNLAVAGKGHYRVRVHYREPDWEAWTPQHVLVMVYPGRGDQVVDLERATRPAGGH